MKLYQLIIMSLTRDKNLYMTHTIRILKKDLLHHQQNSTIVPSFERPEGFYYNQYIGAFQSLEIEKRKAVNRSRSHRLTQESFFRLQGWIKMKMEDNDCDSTFCQTVKHDVFPIRGSNKSIFRMKVTKNMGERQGKQRRRDLSMKMSELRIAPKLLKARPNFSLSKEISSDARKGHKLAKLTLHTSHISCDHDKSALMDSISPW